MTPKRWDEKFTTKPGDATITPATPELQAALVARRAAKLPTLGWSDADLLRWHAQQKRGASETKPEQSHDSAGRILWLELSTHGVEMKIEKKIDDTEAFESDFTAAKVRERVAAHPELYKGIDTVELIARLEKQEADAAAQANPKPEQP